MTFCRLILFILLISFSRLFWGQLFPKMWDGGSPNMIFVYTGIPSGLVKGFCSGSLIPDDVVSVGCRESGRSVASPPRLTGSGSIREEPVVVSADSEGSLVDVVSAVLLLLLLLKKQK